MDSKTLFKFAIISLVAFVSNPASNAILDYFNAVKTVENSSEDKESLNAAHKYVDLGLSVKWATCNVGASSMTDFGIYVAWGETNPNIEYTLYSYSMYDGSIGNCIKYNDSDNLVNLQPEDDVATVKWGEPWRIPTKEEWLELQEKCQWNWEEMDGVYGYKITAQNGNWIFLPAANNRSRFSDHMGIPEGFYWSSTVNEEYKRRACCFEFQMVRSYMIISRSREDGCSVRPVLDTD